MDPDGLFVSALITAGFAAWDTYQYATGKISGADYAVRMTVNGAALIADAASGGMGGGVAVRAAALATRAGKVGAAVVKTATAINKANQIYGQAQAVESFAQGVANGDAKQAFFGAVGTYAAVKAHLPGKAGNVGRIGAASDDAAHLAQGETKLLQKEAQAAGQVEGKVTRLPDEAVVVKGGLAKKARIDTFEEPGVGVVTGTSASSEPAKTVAELSQGLPNKQVRTSTVGEIRQVGGDVIPTRRTVENPYHATITGLDSQQIDKVLQSPIPNPTQK